MRSTQGRGWQCGSWVTVSELDHHVMMFLIHFRAQCATPGYLLLGLISSIVFRAVRSTLRHDPVAQERIIGASLTALALADVSCCYNKSLCEQFSQLANAF